ncbi:hypothetical protein QWY96_02780 [Vibrio artabrorum]|uniref:Uncharacterized protein n=1 Tax=Vibrio artabrorum TaxID=446374 RepID=A0ABT8CGH7_9VIBR|nr:hypothetical protein [Vibrio artabrorum]MDN3700090.1 hypothetical protein [Vibrio artabrorum]
MVIRKIANDTSGKAMRLSKDSRKLGVDSIKAIENGLQEVWVQEIKWPPVNHY